MTEPAFKKPCFWIRSPIWALTLKTREYQWRTELQIILSGTKVTWIWFFHTFVLMVNFETMSFYVLYINKCSKCAVIISTRNSSFSSIKYIFSLSLVCRAQSGDGTLWRHPATFLGLYEVWFFIWKSLCLLQGSRTHGFPLKSYTHSRILLLKSLLSFYRWRER